MENAKLLAFEYIINRLIAWYIEIKQTDTETALKNFNKLKLFKLHFFVAAVNSNTAQTPDLLDTFDRFYALPYGPVEGSIYDHLNELNFYSIYNDHVEIKGKEPDFAGLNLLVNKQIDSAIQALRKKNDNLVALPAFELVEISHKWPVWKLLYAHALKEGRRNESMPGELIRISSKFYE